MEERHHTYNVLRSTGLWTSRPHSTHTHVFVSFTHSLTCSECHESHIEHTVSLVLILVNQGVQQDEE